MRIEDVSKVQTTPRATDPLGNFSVLPTEIFFEIFELLSTPDIANLSVVSKSFWTILQDDNLWTLLFNRAFLSSEKNIEGAKSFYQKRCDLLQTRWQCDMIYPALNNMGFNFLLSHNGRLIFPCKKDVVIFDLRSKSSTSLKNKYTVVFLKLISNELLVSGNCKGRFTTWNIKSGEIINEVGIEPSNILLCSEILNDGKMLIGNSKGTIKIFKPNGKYEGRLLGHHKSRITSLLILDKNLISGSDGEIGIWDLRTQKLSKLIRGQTDLITSFLAFGEDKFISSSNKIQIWNITGVCERTIDVSNQILSLSFASKQHLLSGDVEGRIHVWSLKTGECLRSFHTLTYPIVSLLYTYNRIFIILDKCVERIAHLYEVTKKEKDPKEDLETEFVILNDNLNGPFY